MPALSSVRRTMESKLWPRPDPEIGLHTTIAQPARGCLSTGYPHFPIVFHLTPALFHIRRCAGCGKLVVFSKSSAQRVTESRVGAGTGPALVCVEKMFTPAQ